LQKINEWIQKFALNKNHIKIENDYIRNLIAQQNYKNKNDYAYLSSYLIPFIILKNVFIAVVFPSPIFPINN